MKKIAIVLVALFALGAISVGAASAKSSPTTVPYFLFPILKVTSPPVIDDWPLTPYKLDIPEPVVSGAPNPGLNQNIRIQDDWPETPYKEDLPEKVCD